jgi:5-methylcytosine-specific restriction endonuclease McrA
VSHIPNKLKEEIRLKAKGRCEYCQLSQVGQEATFHVDHIIPRNEEGETTLKNLALSGEKKAFLADTLLEEIKPDIATSEV